ncbi:(d)CMP kinase [Candidatus Profftella armatura (Diaphorina cf. continua)]|uniref:Cytidylate kinase n=1 Tax=Candidatus Profftella armatura (Diaphorina cf. continua) TaxID=2661583 RepID=A0A7R6W0L9_9PROT|nr:(d)CMP kinase [Candidatus Profftella armatura (Diaphorina cf. continua)]BCG49677.1 (d)CMP kinase [Candidatus Profftella armatura (Diaphorina cf. continua)]
MIKNYIPVITIDGPTASGKGTVAQLVASKLGFHYLDSGALYRLVALSAINNNVQLDNELELIILIKKLNYNFLGKEVYLNNFNVTRLIRNEKVGNNASKIATFKNIRKELFKMQIEFRKFPGLVADGRDMGTIVFPDAFLKIFLTANIKQRIERRYKQLIQKGFSVTINDLLINFIKRDIRDKTRSLSPLKCPKQAHLLDTSKISINQAVNQILNWYTKN